MLAHTLATTIADPPTCSLDTPQVLYTERLSTAIDMADCEDEEGVDKDEDAHVEVATGELWDMTRPLEGSCKLWLRTYEDKEGQVSEPRLQPVVHHE